ncbi:MAG: DedA family protein [Planctomycetes bacterium]|nr:DedA family protein [Planctomycetota bacterium]
MADWITSTMESLGYWGVALFMFLENVFPPIPSEIVMPAAGFAAARGKQSFWLVVLAGSVGSLSGTTLWYLLGRAVGHDRARRWADRHGRWLTLSAKSIDNAKNWFERWGRTAVLMCRVIPGVRTLISLPAGAAEMPFLTFVGYSALGTAVWTLGLAWAGWLLGDNYEVLVPYLGWIGGGVLVGLVTWFVVWVVRRRLRGSA